MKGALAMSEEELAALPVVEDAPYPAAVTDARPEGLYYRASDGAVWGVDRDGTRWVRWLVSPAPVKRERRREVWGGPRDLQAIADHLNRQEPGYTLRIRADTLAGAGWNWMLYGDQWHALRGKLFGSAYGTFEKRDGPEYWDVEVREAGERIYDRDGYPLPKAS